MNFILFGICTLLRSMKCLFMKNWVQFIIEGLNDFLGRPNCDNADFLTMVARTPYYDIRHTLFGVSSVSRWDKIKDTGRHLTLYYGHLNVESRLWLNIFM